MSADGCPYEGLSPAAKAIGDALWSTWGANRQTTDWPSEEQLEFAALASNSRFVSAGTTSLIRPGDRR
jgi:hypothetical protein